MADICKHITIIGAGGVATSIVPSLLDAGFIVDCIYSRHIETARVLSSKYGCQAMDNLSEIPCTSDLYLICVSDNAVAEVSGKLHINKNAICVHTAGSLSMNLLSETTPNHGIFYPLQTFSKGRVVDFKQVPLFIEAANDYTYASLHEIAKRLSPMVCDLDEKGRRKLHLAAVIACNFSNHCYAIAEGLLNTQDLPFNILMPLIDETVGKIHTLSPYLAQTGPAIRNDDKVIDMHKRMLDDRRDILAIYEMMTEHIIKYHINKNHD